MLKYEVVDSRNNAGCWIVEAIDYDGKVFNTGAIFTRIFTGPTAQKCALEYAAWKNATIAQEATAVGSSR